MVYCCSEARPESPATLLESPKARDYDEGRRPFVIELTFRESVVFHLRSFLTALQEGVTAC